MTTGKKLMLWGLAVGIGLNAVVSGVLLAMAARGANSGAEVFGLIITLPLFLTLGLILFLVGAFKASNNR